TAYPLKENTRKEVTYWAAFARGGRFEANSEVDEIRWLSVGDAGDLGSYALDRKILKRLDAAHRADSVLMLVRHAKAGRRAHGRGDDARRPLDTTGRTQAGLLAPTV